MDDNDGTRLYGNNKEEKEDKITIEKIDLLDYKFLSVIGKGSYGIVKLCKNIKSGKVFAMKILKKQDLIQSKSYDRVTNEFKVMSRISHPFISELKGYNNEDPFTLNFLMEFVPGGELTSLIRSKTKLPVDHAKFYAAQLLTILDYLHRKSIVHRDIKPENVLIDTTGYLKVSDFGLSKILKNNAVSYTMCGTPEYLSPEMINKSGHGKGVDYWALGIILYEMVVGSTPFQDIDPFKIYQKIIKNKVKYPKDLDKNCKNLIKHLLRIKIEDRYGCRKNGVVDIIDHPFFEGFDWKELLLKNQKAPFIPVVSGQADTSNFKKYFDDFDEDPGTPLNKDKDPFLKWKLK